MSLDSRPLDADQIVDRRRLRRKLTFWRVMAVLVVIAAIGAVAAVSRQSTLTGAAAGSIARVTISGLIRATRSVSRRWSGLAILPPRPSSCISIVPAARRRAPSSSTTR